MELTRGELDAIFGLTDPEKEAVIRLGNDSGEAVCGDVLDLLRHKTIVHESGTELTKLGMLVRDKLLILHELKQSQ